MINLPMGFGLVTQKEYTDALRVANYNTGLIAELQENVRVQKAYEMQLEVSCAALQKNITTLRDELLSTKSKHPTDAPPEQNLTPPFWLDTNRGLQPHRRRAPEDARALIYPYHCFYQTCPHLTAWVKSKGWKGLPFEEKLMAVWEYVAVHVDYEYDHDGDHFQYPCETDILATGNCNDVASLTVALWLEAGVPPQDCFAAYGWSEWGPHAFPIARRSDGDWYVYEGTLNFIPESGPVLLRGSNYDVSFGLANKRFSGHPFDQYTTRVQGAVGKTKGLSLVQFNEKIKEVH